MKTISRSVLGLLWGVFLLLTSVYCLLAFLPYTNASLIKSPPYAWMPWFVHHHAALYWLALAAATGAFWRELGRKTSVVLFGLQAALGVAMVLRPFMGTLESTWSTYAWSLAALAPLVVVCVAGIWTRQNASTQQPRRLLDYWTAVGAAIAVAVLWVVAVKLRTYLETQTLEFRGSDFELALWSLLSHVLLAAVVVSVLNLIFVLSLCFRDKVSARRAAIGGLTSVVLWLVFRRFLNTTLSFDGWAAELYAAALSAALTLFFSWMVLPLLPRGDTELKPVAKKLLIAALVAVALFTVVFPWLVGNADWSGVMQSTGALAVWIALGVGAYTLRPRKADYSVATLVAVLVLGLALYKGLQISAIFWGAPLGQTDDDIAVAMENYATRDASFQLAHHALGNGRAEKCGDLCRILRQHTNITNFDPQTEVKLVDPLAPTKSDRPNIFIFVIDSMRPDYLGAYNPKVDFTPNLDAFARDSVVMKNVYTQYAGTSLSEPAIWAGAMLLHHHDLKSFPKVNSLQKLAAVDNYQMLLSYDAIMGEMNVSSPDMIKVDTDKALWNQHEACSTVQETERALDARADKSHPVFFYAQPMNVHQFARNGLPGPASSPEWHARPGFNDRIAFEVNYVDKCLGGFFSYLKARGLYDNSIVLVASDHGDATGEFGRISHSTAIYPEIMRVPLIVHLPKSIREKVVYDDSRVSALTDITPSLYYLLGHRPVKNAPLFGRPLFAETREELESYQRGDLLMASDVRAVYGVLAQNGRFLYATYDSPAQSMLFDLQTDPNAQHNILTGALKQHYDEQIIGDLHKIGDFYGYHPGLGSLLAAKQ